MWHCSGWQPARSELQWNPRNCHIPLKGNKGNSNVPVAIEDLFVMRCPSGLLLCKQKRFILFQTVLTNSIKPVWWWKKRFVNYAFDFKKQQAVSVQIVEKSYSLEVKHSPWFFSYQTESSIFRLSLVSRYYIDIESPFYKFMKYKHSPSPKDLLRCFLLGWLRHEPTAITILWNKCSIYFNMKSRISLNSVHIKVSILHQCI